MFHDYTNGVVFDLELCDRSDRSIKAMTPPKGLRYFPDFLSISDEQNLLQEISRLPMAPFQMRGVTSRRLVLHFGWDYGYDSWQITPAAPLPTFLCELRAKATEFLK